MTIKTINIVLFLVFIVLVGMIVLVRRDYTTRNVELLPGMVTSVAYQPQSPNTNWPDGKTLQPPVRGAVIRGFEPFPYRATPSDALRAGLELRSPLDPKDSTADLARGAFVFGNMCKPCHGPTGAGDGPVPQHGFPPPPSFNSETAVKMKDGQMVHIITVGQRNMPGLAAQVTRLDRWRVTKYVRSLQEKSRQAGVVVR